MNQSVTTRKNFILATEFEFFVMSCFISTQIELEYSQAVHWFTTDFEHKVGG